MEEKEITVKSWLENGIKVDSQFISVATGIHYKVIEIDRNSIRISAAPLRLKTPTRIHFFGDTKVIPIIPRG